LLCQQGDRRNPHLGFGGELMRFIHHEFAAGSAAYTER
jgi:hypothetical protein